MSSTVIARVQLAFPHRHTAVTRFELWQMQGHEMSSVAWSGEAGAQVQHAANIAQDQEQRCTHDGVQSSTCTPCAGLLLFSCTSYSILIQFLADKLTHGALFARC